MRDLDKLFYPIHSRPYGFSYSQWTAIWWRWLLEIPKKNNPVYDSDGSFSKINQNYPLVYFLCQTCDKADSIPNRRILLPLGCGIFMPIINWISFPDNENDTNEVLVEDAKKRMDAIGELQITIYNRTFSDGLNDYRARSSIFNCRLPKDNIFGMPPGNTRAVSDGYWLFLRPLRRDTGLSTYGTCSSGVNRISVNYIIELV